MSRPRGEVRQALATAGAALAVEQGGFTWRDVAQVACVGFAVARQTVRDMERAGELRRVGRQAAAHSCRPMNVYEPVSGFGHAPEAAPDPQLLSLDQVLGIWVLG